MVSTDLGDFSGRPYSSVSSLAPVLSRRVWDSAERKGCKEAQAGAGKGCKSSSCSE